MKDLITIKNKSLGFKFKVGSNFKQVQNSEFKKLNISLNTIYVFMLSKFQMFEVSIVSNQEENNFETILSYNLKKVSDEFMLLDKGTYVAPSVGVKEILLKEKDKKYLVAFVNVNDLTLLFTLNLVNYDLNIIDEDNEQVMILHDILKSIETCDPKIDLHLENIYEEKEKEKKQLEDSLALRLIKNDLRYQGSFVPDFYFKYSYKEKKDYALLSIKDNKVFFQGGNNSFRLITEDESLGKSMHGIIYKYLNSLLDINIKEQPIHNSLLYIKIDDKAIVIDMLDKDNVHLLSKVFKDICLLFKSHFKYDFSNFRLLPFDLEEEKEEVKEEVKEEEIKEDKIKEVEKKEELVKENKEEEKETYNKSYFKIDTKELDNVSSKMIYHYVPHQALFKFMIPSNFDTKIKREDNVFDVQDGDNYLRVFMFKCLDEEKFLNKVHDWMRKNVESSNSELLEESTITLSNNIKAYNYLLSSSKFYQIIYYDNYLIAVSGEYNDQNIIDSHFILVNVHLSHGDQEFNEALGLATENVLRLKKEGFDYNYSDIDKLVSGNIYLRDGEAVFKRAIALMVSANFAYDISESKSFLKIRNNKKDSDNILRKYHAMDALTKKEKELFKDKNQNLAVDLSWQFEGLKVLLWSLSLIDDLDIPKDLVDADTLSEMILSKGYLNLLKTVNLRDLEEIKKEADRNLRYSEYLEKVKEDERLSKDIIIERRRAFRWLLTKTKWDDISI